MGDVSRAPMENKFSTGGEGRPRQAERVKNTGAGGSGTSDTTIQKRMSDGRQEGGRAFQTHRPIN